MKFVVAGGSGFVGEPLVRHLLTHGEVVVLTRSPFRVKFGRGVRWSPPTIADEWKRELADSDVVISLAGAGVAEGRWNEQRKKELIDSRVDVTRALVEAMPRDRRLTLISASAVGYYGSRGDESLHEASAPGSDFLARLAERWESEARAAEPFARVIILRFGIILAPDGGALGKMLLPYRLFAGGPIASGQQWMPWIDRRDVIDIIGWAVSDERAAGIYNVVSPNPVRNSDFSKTLGRVLHRPALARVPAIALRVAMGEMAEPLLLTSQKVLPVRLVRDGFEFKHPDLEEALRTMLR